MSRDTIKDLILMLMYFTYWEESLVPGIRRKPDHPAFTPRPVSVGRATILAS